jgi:hypothetical protein
VQWLRAEGEERFVGSLKIAIFYSLVYSVVTVIIAAFVTSSDDSFWDPSRLDVKAVALGVLIWISLVPLVPVLLLTGESCPSSSPPQRPKPASAHRSQPARHRRPVLPDRRKTLRHRRPRSRAACSIFGRGRGVLSRCCSGPW